MDSCKIPKVYRSSDININDLCVDKDEVNGTVISLREQYAQEALILFLPFQEDSDLRSIDDNIYWKSFTRYKKRIYGRSVLKFFKIIRICSI